MQLRRESTYPAERGRRNGGKNVRVMMVRRMQKQC